MITRSRAKKQFETGIHTLPKEVLINLLMFLEPSEIRLICQSDNPKIREICASPVFRQAYAQKYPKKLLRGRVDVTGQGKSSFEITGRHDDTIYVRRKSDGEIRSIKFTPRRQIFPSTFVPEVAQFDTNALRFNNPMQIILYKDDDGKFKMEIGRENIYGVNTKEEDETFRRTYNQEVKEFLQSIERENWWSPTIQFRSNEASELAMIEFYNQVNDLTIEMGLEPLVLE